MVVTRDEFNFSPDAVTNRVTKPSIKNMTFEQLQQELLSLENLPASWHQFNGGTEGATATHPAGQKRFLRIGAGDDEFSVRLCLCVFFICAGWYSPWHPGSPPGNECRYPNGLDFGGCLLRLCHAGPIAGGASGIFPAPDFVGAQSDFSGGRRGLALAGEPGNMKSREYKISGYKITSNQ